VEIFYMGHLGFVPAKQALCTYVHVTSQQRRCDHLTPITYSESVANLAQIFGHFLSAALSHTIG